MDRSSFKNKRVLIMGLGLQGGGVGSALFFARNGAKVTVTDLKSSQDLKPSIAALGGYDIHFVLGKHDPRDLKNIDWLIKNPGIPEDSGFLKKARSLGVSIEMEESLFAQLCPVPIIGITGTRGKSTVTALAAQALRSAGLKIKVAGNMRGASTLTLLFDISDEDYVILELSSWQLAGFRERGISPHIGLITNIYPDHLNRYQSMADYIKDKKAIFAWQKAKDWLILNSDDKIVSGFAKEAKSKVKFFSAEDDPKNWPLKLRGWHNLQNIACVWKLCEILKIQNDNSKKALQNFPGLPFRLETIRNYHGVRIVNDTTSTTPTATIVALNNFSSNDLVLLFGGTDKNLPLDKLIKILGQKSIKHVTLLKGTGTQKLLAEVEKTRPELTLKFSQIFDDLAKAVKDSLAHVQAGEILLFSPGFTSFAMFNNEFERGEEFNRLINNLP